MQVVWALLQCFLFRVKCSLAIGVVFSLVFQKLYKGTPGFKPGTSRTAVECSTTEFYPRCMHINNITANTCRLFEHCYNVFCSESGVLSRSMSFFSSLSKIIQGDTRVRTRDLSDCSWMLYHWAISPLHTDSIKSLQTRAGCLSIVTMFFVPSQVFSRDQWFFSNFFLVFQKLYKGTPGFEPGTSRTEPNALPLFFSSLSKIIQGDTRVRTRDLSDCSRMLYHWAISPLHTDCKKITANMCRLFEHCYNMFCSESSVLSRSMSFFSSLSKIVQGDTRVRTRDLKDCSWMIFHWALSPLHAYSITSPQTRAGCLSIVTMFFRVKCSLAIDVVFL